MMEYNPPKDAILTIIKKLDSGDTSRALIESKEMLSSYPGSYILYNLIGIIYAKIQEFDQALSHYEKALEIFPKYSDVYNNLGLLYSDKNLYRLSRQSFEKAIILNPNFKQAIINLSWLHFNQSEYLLSFDLVIKSILIDQNDEKTLIILGNLLNKIQFGKCYEILYEPIIVLLTKFNHVQPRNIAHSLIGLIKHDDVMKELLKIEILKVSNIEFLDILKKLSNFKILITLMELAPVPDVEVETILTQIRKRLIKEKISDHFYPAISQFITALSCQCNINEFLYTETQTETVAIKDLEAQIFNKIKNNSNLSIMDINLLSMYKPLEGLDWAIQINKSSIPEHLSTRITEYEEEKIIKKNIKKYKLDEGVTSIKVREQYEENPYPRWIKPLIYNSNTSIIDFFNKHKIKLKESNNFNLHNPEILVAGCGTGQHAINTASIFKQSNITAIDLSINSLSYALRKSKELKINNITFFQCDILNVAMMKKKFDIIESVGVIHHMQDPMSGLSALLSVLNKNGLLKLGLYSSLGRRNITEYKKKYLSSDINLELSRIKEHRKNIAENVSEKILSIMKFNDFYSLSEFRDMVLHFQEHTFNIKDIKKILSDFNLFFCGFNIDYMNASHQNFDVYDLDYWFDLEQKNPDLFQSMYQFWCQKTSENL